ncbi:MAG: hypothetical protein QOI38_1901 [Sphingomonadales bacterium]|jgi:hypothetical protein|nr:hypothetical protein [Sphingomonadales bacterium]
MKWGMHYFVDSEFNGFGGALISLAAVPEDEAAPPFYEAVECRNPCPWVREHVLPVIQTEPRPMAEVARLFAEFLSDDPAPVIVADWPEDIAQAATLLANGEGGRLLHSEVLFRLLSAPDFSADRLSKVPHNAYYDALALRDWVLGAKPPDAGTNRGMSR